MNDKTEDRRALGARRGAIAALLAVAAIGLGACGEDSESSTSSTTTATGPTGATGATGATGTDGDSDSASAGAADFAAVTGALEDADFSVKEQSGQDLVTTVGLPKPITADEGVVATPSGQPGDVIVQSFSDPADAADVEKAQDTGFTEAELVEGTIVVVGTDDSADLIADAVDAIEG